MSTVEPLTCPNIAGVPRPLQEYFLRLLRNVAWFCSREREKRAFTVIVRQRPVDSRGRTGCCMEIRLDGHSPSGGLKAIRCAGGDDALLPHELCADEGLLVVPGTALSVAMDEVLAQCRITVAARWPDQSG